MTRFRDLKAKDIMKTDVVSFSPDTSIETAISTFEDLHIGGVPVVGANGKLIGVLSATDVVRSEHVAGARIETGRGDSSMSFGEDEDDDFFEPEEVVLIRDDYSPEVRGQESVGDWMSTGVTSVSPEDSIRKLCSVMVAGNYHRVCVVEGDKLVGIVTSFDVVRAISERL